MLYRRHSDGFGRGDALGEELASARGVPGGEQASEVESGSCHPRACSHVGVHGERVVEVVFGVVGSAEAAGEQAEVAGDRAVAIRPLGIADHGLAVVGEEPVVELGSEGPIIDGRGDFAQVRDGDDPGFEAPVSAVGEDAFELGGGVVEAVSLKVEVGEAGVNTGRLEGLVPDPLQEPPQGGFHLGEATLVAAKRKQLQAVDGHGERPEDGASDREHAGGRVVNVVEAALEQREGPFADPGPPHLGD